MGRSRVGLRGFQRAGYGLLPADVSKRRHGRRRRARAVRRQRAAHVPRPRSRPRGRYVLRHGLDVVLVGRRRACAVPRRAGGELHCQHVPAARARHRHRGAERRQRQRGRQHPVLRPGRRGGVGRHRRDGAADGRCVDMGVAPTRRRAVRERPASRRLAVAADGSVAAPAFRSVQGRRRADRTRPVAAHAARARRLAARRAPRLHPGASFRLGRSVARPADVLSRRVDGASGERGAARRRRRGEAGGGRNASKRRATRPHADRWKGESWRYWRSWRRACS